MNRQTVKINTGRGYRVIIEDGILSACGEISRDIIGDGRVAIITDSNVAGLYLGKAEASFRDSDIETEHFIFDAGERSKNIGTLSRILEFLADVRFTRSDTVVALGGGVVGDISGFAASVFMRGVRFIQIPTTLLADIDSSVGGKTAIDLTAGKNLAGTFKQPDLVICDPALLSTLPYSEFTNGIAEAVKYGVLFSEELFESFGKELSSEQMTDIIAKCVGYKGSTVEADEYDEGDRRLLNLGHTIGHAIEKCSDYGIPHGHAVAAGTAMMARAGEKLGITEKGTVERTEEMLRRYSLPVRTGYTTDELVSAALSDKKRSGDTITLVVPEKIGRCILVNEPVEALERYIRLGKGD